jgi:hypothetical protein
MAELNVGRHIMAWRTALFSVVLGGVFSFGTAPAKAVCSIDGSECCNHLSNSFEYPCSGYWNVFASIPDGDRWEHEKVGHDPIASNADRQARSIEGKLKRCGIGSMLINSTRILGFRENLLVVVTGVYRSQQEAASELKAAKQCGHVGYTKAGSWSVPDPD